MKRVMIILGIISLVGLPGCGKSENASIVGKWKEVGDTQTIEFFKDGTVTIIDEGEPPITGDYKFIDKNHVRMDFKGLGELLGAVVIEFSDSGEEFSVTNPFGEVEKYRRFEEQDRLQAKREKEGINKIGESNFMEATPSDQMVWIKCNNPDCKAEYQMSKRKYYAELEKRYNPIGPAKIAIPCQKCSQESCFEAIKCPKCGYVFFKGIVPNDLEDRCPKCKHSAIEESRKARLTRRK